MLPTQSHPASKFKVEIYHFSLHVSLWLRQELSTSPSTSTIRRPIPSTPFPVPYSVPSQSVMPHGLRHWTVLLSWIQWKVYQHPHSLFACTSALRGRKQHSPSTSHIEAMPVHVLEPQLRRQFQTELKPTYCLAH